MIRLTCANCKNVLEVDDAFAGGVCRCQHCGTIQTVPKNGNRPRSPSGAKQSGPKEEPKALYQVKSRAGMSSHPSGLEELAEVVHSSGLMGSGLSNRPPRTVTYATPQQQKHAKKMTLIAIASGAAVAIIGLVLVYFFLSRSSSSNAGNGAVAPVVTAEPVSTPNFAGAALSGNKVVYVIDRGDATATYFDAVKKLVTRSVLSLGADRRFAVMLWSNGSNDAFPRSGTVFATSEEASKLASWLDEASIGRASSVESALQNGLAQSPDEIVLLTAKADQLADSMFAADVLKARGSKSTKIHGITLGESPAEDPLKKIATETGGKFVHVTRNDIKTVGQ